MEDANKLRLMLFFMIFYLLVFTFISVIEGNYEFIFYSINMTIILVLIGMYRNEISLSVPLAVGFVVMVILHTFGGFIHLHGTRLYDYWLIPNILKYDNVSHFIGAFITSFVAYNLLLFHFDKKKKLKNIILIFLILTISLGIHSINEILEFMAVVFLGASNAVGGYYNNSLDLVFNFLGAFFGGLIILYYYTKKG